MRKTVNSASLTSSLVDKPRRTNCWTLVMLVTSRDVSICGETKKIADLLTSGDAQ
jgi:hypothetical protein